MKQAIINGQCYSFKEEQTILGLLRSIDMEVAALCYDERLQPASVCRLCLVKIKGKDRLQPSCRTLLDDKMEIEIHSPDIESYRKGILQKVRKIVLSPPAVKADWEIVCLIAATMGRKELFGNKKCMERDIWNYL